MVPLTEVSLGKEKWKEWGVFYWVCESEDGEVVDSIERGHRDLFTVYSNNKQYTSLKAAQAGSAKYRLTKLKQFHEELLMKKEEAKDEAGKIPRGRGVRGTRAPTDFDGDNPFS